MHSFYRSGSLTSVCHHSLVCRQRKDHQIRDQGQVNTVNTLLYANKMCVTRVAGLRAWGLEGLKAVLQQVYNGVYSPLRFDRGAQREARQRSGETEEDEPEEHPGGGAQAPRADLSQQRQVRGCELQHLFCDTVGVSTTKTKWGHGFCLATQ